MFCVKDSNVFIQKLLQDSLREIVNKIKVKSYDLEMNYYVAYLNQHKFIKPESNTKTGINIIIEKEMEQKTTQEIFSSICAQRVDKDYLPPINIQKILQIQKSKKSNFLQEFLIIIDTKGKLKEPKTDKPFLKIQPEAGIGP